MNEKMHGFWCYLKKIRLIAGTITTVLVLLVFVCGYIYRIGIRVEKVKTNIKQVPINTEAIGKNKEKISGHDTLLTKMVTQIENIDENVRFIRRRLDR